MRLVLLYGLGTPVAPFLFLRLAVRHESPLEVLASAGRELQRQGQVLVRLPEWRS